MYKKLSLSLIAGAMSLVVSSAAIATVVMKPTSFTQNEYSGTLLTGSYNSNITPPEQLLGFDVGQQTATPEQINRAVRHWAEQSSNVKLIEYAKSYEGRSLHYLVISSEDNLARLDEIKANAQKLAHPNKYSKTEINTLINSQPATAWMAYSIHGNESSGSDSALAFIYHLIASNDVTVEQQLKDMVIIIDPMMNPDGRARFTKKLQEHRGTAPNVDTQSLLHSDVWPWGRTNHYYFDLNRDFYFTVNPESRGRVEAINDWYPQLMIDAHEQGALDNYLMGPPREPINPHIPESKKHWGEVFSTQQGEAFDQQNWRFYTGEWFENLYPGYSNYAEYRGSVHILYEQARTAEDGVRLANGNVRTYKESVHHQLVSSLANLKTLHQNSKALYQDFVKDRRNVASAKSPYADQSFVILPSKNNARITQFIELMQRQDINVYRTTKSLKVSNATTQQGKKLKSTTIPKGTLVVPNRQAEARLIAAILEFDTKISPSVLLEERQKTLRNGSSVMYDTTAWNVTMMYGMEALQVAEHIDDNLMLVEPVNTTIKAGGLKDMTDNAIAYYVSGESDDTLGFAARLLEQNVKVRVLDKASQLGSHNLSRGSVVINKVDNTLSNTNLEQIISATAKESGVWVDGITQGAGTEFMPDIGSRHFTLLEKPQIAVLAQKSVNFYDMGTIWHLIDTKLGVRHSYLDSNSLAYMDLSRYNVLVLPDQFSGKPFTNAEIKKLDNWVKNGGTLIAIDGSAKALINAEKFSQVKLLDQIAEQQDDFDLSLQREWLAKKDKISNAKVVNAYNVPNKITFPWSTDKESKAMDKKSFEKWSKWTRNFMPSGAFVSGTTDQKHWLTYGVNETLPLLVADAPVFMSDDNSQAVIRFGSLTKDKEAEATRLGWANIPKGYKLQLRMSGLVWPEAQQRFANGAYLTRESKGRGQVIMFSGQPNFRGATQGTARLLLNAIVYGPGLGARTTINL